MGEGSPDDWLWAVFAFCLGFIFGLVTAAVATWLIIEKLTGPR
jgi:hypothetical protein